MSSYNVPVIFVRFQPKLKNAEKLKKNSVKSNLIEIRSAVKRVQTDGAISIVAYESTTVLYPTNYLLVTQFLRSH